MAKAASARACAFGLAAMALVQPAAAQAPGRWQVHQLPSGVMLATSGGGLSFLCMGTAPVLALNLQPPARRNPALATVTIDGQARSLTITRDTSAGVWTAPLAGSGLLEAAVLGKAADIAVEGAMRGRIPLQGAATAIRQALAGCWPASGFASAQAKPIPPAAAQIEERFFGIPMRLGYYAWADETCSKATHVMRFERDRYFDIHDVGLTEYTIADVTGPDSEGWYMLDWRTVDGEPVEEPVEGEEGATVSGAAVRPRGTGRIEILIQDNALFRHCSVQEIPARLRR